MTAPALIEKARAFATAAHAGQQRKYTGEPYINHPEEVARIVAEAGGDSAMICAALLHDVVEDCGVLPETILAEFGAEVAELVYWLTAVSTPADGNRAARKALDHAHMAKASAAAQTVKLADLISNSRTIIPHGRGFARVYLAEMAAQLAVMHEGDPELHRRAVAIVQGASES